jgi:hypothetical protein
MERCSAKVESLERCRTTTAAAESGVRRATNGRRILLGALLGVGLVAWGCGAPPRPVMTDAQLVEQSRNDAVKIEGTFRDAIGRMLERIEKRALASGTWVTPTVNVLAMSGGGDYGAFGAGLLVGWGSAPGEARRPDFDAVTGVSTGALLAPFAYVGTDESCKFVESFYRNPKPDWVQSRGWFFFLPGNPSFMTIPGLERDLRGIMDAKFVGELAGQSKAGKVLVISASNVDLGRQRFWDLGAESQAAAESGNFDRVVKILMASAAIPAVFPPVQIDEFLYADGGVTANVFLRLDPSNPDGLLPRWQKKFPGKPLPKTRYWIIVNNQLRQPPKTVQPKWPDVMSPALATAIRSATVAEIRWLTAQADYVNAAWKADIEVRVVAIPDDWRAPVKGDFKKETMESLSDLGRKLGADPKSWMLWAAPGQDISVPQ